MIFLWTGTENNLYFQFAESKTVARVSKYEISQIGDKVSFVFMPHKLHFFDSTTEKNNIIKQKEVTVCIHARRQMNI